MRILSQLIVEAKQKQETTKITLGISYIEFIGETVRDLINGKMIDKIQVNFFLHFLLFL